MIILGFEITRRNPGRFAEVNGFLQPASSGVELLDRRIAPRQMSSLMGDRKGWSLPSQRSN